MKFGKSVNNENDAIETALMLAAASDENDADADDADDEGGDELEVALPEDKESIKRAYIGPAEVATTGGRYVSAVEEICEAENVSVLYNFDTGADIPEGYGIYILPIKQRGETPGPNVLDKVLIAVIPDTATVLAHESGREYVERTLRRQMGSKLVSAIKSGDTEVGTIPFSITDFLAPRRGGGAATFDELAPEFVKALKSLGLKLMNKALLRSCLSNAAFAVSQYPKVEQATWKVVLDKMIAKANSATLDTSGLVNWRNTRDEKTAGDMSVDADKLAALLA